MTSSLGNEVNENVNTKYCGDYDGEYRHGQRHGFGVLTWPDGCVYKGQFFNGLRHGEGELIARTAKGIKVYKGNFKNGKKEGYGEETIENSNELVSSYEGDWENNVFSGNGYQKSNNGKLFAGEFRDGNKEGYGLMIYPDGSFYEGFFSKNIFNGFGIYFSDDHTYEGFWKHGSMNGKGELKHYTKRNSSKCKEKDFVEKKIEMFNGNWHNGTKHGECIHICEDGAAQRSLWKQGSFVKHIGTESKLGLEEFIYVSPPEKNNNFSLNIPKIMELKQVALFRRSFLYRKNSKINIGHEN